MVEYDRRTVLHGVGVGGTAGLAGCTSLDSGTGDDGSDEAGERAAGVDERAAGVDEPADGIVVALELDRAALERRDQELRQQVQAEEVTPAEAQDEFEAFQAELAGDAADEFEAETDDIVVESRALARGALVVDGSAEQLIDALAYDSVAALLPSDALQAGAGGP